MSEEIFGFNSSDAERLIRLLESKYRGYGASRLIYPHFYLAVSSGTITAAAGTTLGSGAAMLKTIDAGNTLRDYKTATVLNPSTAIDSGKLMFVFRVGTKYVVAEVCP